MIIAVDFDGVIHDYKNPIEGRRMGAPIEGTQEALVALKDDGHEIIVFCLWGHEAGQETIRKFMEYYQLPYDSITNIKPKADYYIDDRAIKFINWKDAFKEMQI